MNNQTVQDYFSRYAQGFDSIYSGNKNPVLKLMDSVLRKDMFQRMQLTLLSCDNPEGKRILDVGCGSGRFSIELARRGGTVTGIDFAVPMLDLARKFAAEANVASSTDFVRGDFLTYPFQGKFDIVLAIGFFDYTKDARVFLERAHRVTVGKVIATFPRRWIWRMPLRKARLGLLRCPVYFYGREQVEKTFFDAGFEVSRLETLSQSFWVEARPRE